jgi:hypothetical protein
MHASRGEQHVQHSYDTNPDEEAALAWMAAQQGLADAEALWQQSCQNLCASFVAPFKAQQKAALIHAAEAALAAGKGFEVTIDQETQQPIGAVKES